MQLRAAGRRSLLAIATLLAIVPAMAGFGRSQAPQPDAQRPLALLADIDGAIGPGTAHYVERAVDAARERKANVLILRLDTPGGLSDSMRDIISAILASPVPVVGYVAPSGAHAASAGTYILYATQVAAMAPGTNIGAATPVQIGGLPGLPSPGESGRKGDGVSADPMRAKMTNDAVAFIRSLAEMHGRNADWAERAVREAATLGPRQALEMKVIDLVAGNLDDLLARIDGRRVSLDGTTVRLATANARVERLAPGLLTRILGVLSNPNVAFILLMIGVYGLIFEFLHPGAIAPGVVGAICLVLGAYALNQLPLDLAGLALLVLGIALMVAEAVTPTLGVLGVGGLAAFVIGAAMLIDTDMPAYRLSWWTIGSVAATSGAFLVLLLGFVWRTYRRRHAHTSDGVIDTPAQVLDWSGDNGHVLARGERWAARDDTQGEAQYAAGETVRVRGIDGLTLLVGNEAAHGAAGPDNKGD